jgi:hypothetical protein
MMNRVAMTVAIGTMRLRGEKGMDRSPAGGSLPNRGRQAAPGGVLGHIAYTQQSPPGAR